MTFAGQQPAQTPIAEAAPLLRQLAQALTQRRIVRAPGLIAPYRTIDPHQPAGASLTQPVLLDQPVHRDSSRRRLQPFFPSRSLSAALSSIASASSFFSRRFSSSSDFSRRASETSSPPYFAFHYVKCRALRSRAAGIPLGIFAPASCSRSTPMICSSLNRLPFIRPSPLRDGLYFKSRAFQGCMPLKPHGSVGCYSNFSGDHRPIYFDYYDLLAYFPFPDENFHAFDPDSPRYGGPEHPMSAYPSFLEKLRGREMQQIWYRTGHALSKADEVEIWGYSLPESDVAVRTLLNVLRFRLKKNRRS